MNTRGSTSLRKIIVLLLALLIPVIIISSFFMFYSFYGTKRDVTAHIISLARNYVNEADDMLGNCNYYLVDTLRNNGNIHKIKDAAGRNELNTSARQLWNELDNQLRFLPMGFSFFFYNPEKDVYITRIHPGAFHTEHYSVRDSLLAGIDSGSEEINTRTWSYCFVAGHLYFYQVYEYEGSYLGGWISGGEMFEGLISEILTDNASYAVFDRNGAVLAEAGATPPPGGLTETFGLERSNVRLTVFDKPYINIDVLKYPVIFSGLTLLTIISVSAYAVNYFRRRIEMPLLNIQNHINSYTKTAELKKHKGFSEFYAASDTFDYLVGQINTLKIDVYEKRLLQAKTELEYYQLQIKPHFFINCFSIIHAMAQVKSFDRIEVFCIKLSNYVRYLMKDSADMVSVETELSLIREYIDIQNIRYRSSISFEEHIEKEFLSFQIPSLVFQTLAENSIKHADIPNESLIISVTSRLSGDGGLCFEIADNGKGFTDGQLAQFNDYKNTGLTDATINVGIRNTFKRMSLIYGGRFEMRFANANPGAKVVLKIPYEENINGGVR